MRLLLRYRNVTRGRDDALASFVDGWLHVEGRRASFSLRPMDVRLHDGPTLSEVRLETERGDSIVLESVSAWENSARSSFREATRTWVSTNAMPVGEPILPPRAVPPETYARTLVHAILITTVCATTACAFETFPASLQTEVLRIVFASVAILTPFLAVRNVSVLRRLDERA